MNQGEDKSAHDSSKVKFLWWIARDKRVPRSALITSKKSAKCMPWAHLTSRLRLSDKTIFKHERITHNRPTKALLENHVFNPPINYSDARDKRKERKWQVPKKFSDEKPKRRILASTLPNWGSICSFGQRWCTFNGSVFHSVLMLCHTLHWVQKLSTTEDTINSAGIMFAKVNHSFKPFLDMQKPWNIS